MTSERRQAPRVGVQIWVEEATEHERYFQHSADLSTGGIYLKNTIPRPVGTIVNLSFSLPGSQDKFETKAEVVGAIAGEKEMGMSLKFIDLPPAHVEQIRKFIEAHAEG